ncbi:MAG: type III secretion system cytoplasmic ring protein SctQ [Pseudomonadota bacterium]
MSAISSVEPTLVPVLMPVERVRMPEDGSVAPPSGLEPGTAADASLANLVASRAPSFDAPLAEGTVAMRLATGVVGDAALTVPARFGSGSGTLAFDAPSLRVLLPDIAASTDPDTLPDALWRALAEAVAGPIISGLSSLGLGVELVDDTPDTSPHELLLLPADGGAWRVGLHLSDAARADFATMLERLPPRDHRIDDAIPVRLEALLAGPSIPLRAASTLACGDAILLPVSPQPDRVALTTRTGRRVVGHGRVQGTSVTIEEVTTVSKKQMRQRADEAEIATLVSAPETDAPAPTSLDDLELRLSFLLGACTTDVATLRALAPGYVLTLDAPATTEVTIRAEGREIGRGEIVALEDRLAVRVTRLWSYDRFAAEETSGSSNEMLEDVGATEAIEET